MSRMLFLGLLGCNPSGFVEVAGVADDTGAVPLVGSPSGGTEAGHMPSALVTLRDQGDCGPEYIEAEVLAADSDGDLAQVEIEIEGVATAFPLSGATDSLVYCHPYNECTDLGASIPVDVTVRDAGGRVWAEAQDITPPGLSVVVTELGDGFTSKALLGALASPTVVCGSMYSTAPAAPLYCNVEGQDCDWFEFQAPETGDWHFDLTWVVGGGDYDLRTFTAGICSATVHDTADDHTGAQPETIVQPLVEGETYCAMAAGWGGDTGDWKLRIWR